MKVMLEATYPGTKAKEAGTKFLEIMKDDPPPEYVKIIDLYAAGGGDGYRVLLFYGIDDGKEGDGMRYISRGIVAMLNAIEGYKCESHVVYNMAEAFEFLGMTAPSV